MYESLKMLTDVWKGLINIDSCMKGSYKYWPVYGMVLQILTNVWNGLISIDSCMEWSYKPWLMYEMVL